MCFGCCRAICNPSHYSVLTNSCLCSMLIFSCWGMASLSMLSPTILYAIRPSVPNVETASSAASSLCWEQPAWAPAPMKHEHCSLLCCAAELLHTVFCALCLHYMHHPEGNLCVCKATIRPSSPAYPSPAYPIFLHSLLQMLAACLTMWGLKRSCFVVSCLQMCRFL